jgi:hypothetical protein
MLNTTTGTVLSVKRQWWLKIRTKSFSTGIGDDAIYPHVLKVRYTVDGIEYTRNKWILTKKPIPQEGDTIQLTYDDLKPERIKLVL